MSDAAGLDALGVGGIGRRGRGGRIVTWDEESMLRRFVWGYAHRFAMRAWITASRELDPYDPRDLAEVMGAIRFELGQGALDGLDPEMVEDAIKCGMVDRQPHW